MCYFIKQLQLQEKETETPISYNHLGCRWFGQDNHYPAYAIITKTSAPVTKKEKAIFYCCYIPSSVGVNQPVISSSEKYISSL
jgi:hypothetical protein